MREGEKKSWRKPCLNVTFIITTPALASLESKPDIRDDSLAPCRHSQGHTAVMLIYYNRKLKITCVFNGKIFISDLLKTHNSVKTINHAGTKGI